MHDGDARLGAYFSGQYTTDYLNESMLNSNRFLPTFHSSAAASVGIAHPPIKSLEAI